MPSDRRQEMHDAAIEEIERLIETNPGFSLDPRQPRAVAYQLQGGGTNFLLWGHYRGQPVVYKYYHPDWGAMRWRNERACLEHFAGTGWVPKLHAASPKCLIVMSCLPGRFLDQELDSGELSPDDLAHLGHELGKAIGRMVDAGLPPVGDGYSIARDFGIMPWNSNLPEAVRFYLRLCRGDQRSASSQDPFYMESLRLVEGQVDRIAGQRPVIYHEDFHCFVHKGRLQGFFDLEMCRLGTEFMYLERVFRQCSPDGVSWPSFLGGYREETGRGLDRDDYLFMLAMSLFYYHIRITRWGSPNREADWVAKYLPDMRKEVPRYADYVDLAAHLPGF